MAQIHLGISLYPERTTFEADVAYMEKAAALGFDRLFIALLGTEEGREGVIARYKPLLSRAKELGFEIMADVNPMVFSRLGVNASIFGGKLDLSLFTELGVDVLRLDIGMSDLEEAFLSKNPDGLVICMNGATTVDHAGHVLAVGGDAEHIMGCMNYYPHRYTGNDVELYLASAKVWKSHNMRLATFVTSQNPDDFGPWPVTEGLPTLECHRSWPIALQVKHYVMMGGCTDILIGDAYATDEELAAMAEANSPEVTFTTTLAEGLPESQARRLRMPLSVRPDLGSYLVRSLESRMMREEVEPFNTVPIRRGDVLIDNKLYAQYSGEVQIALRDMENSGKTNVVGRIAEEELALLDLLRGGMPFGFTF